MAPAHTNSTRSTTALSATSPSATTGGNGTGRNETDDAHCRRCGRDVTRIDMVRNGLELEFVSCSVCDTREWMRNGETVDLDLLLEEMVAAREAGTEAAAVPTASEVPVVAAVANMEADPVQWADVAARFVA